MKQVTEGGPKKLDH